MDYDALLPEVGAFGRYQKILIGVILIPTVFPCAFQAYSQLFIAATPNHWCRIPELDEFNDVHMELIKQISIPQELHYGQLRYEECRMFKRNYTDIRLNFDLYVRGRNESANVDTVACQQGWQYDKSLYPSTAVTEVR